MNSVRKINYDVCTACNHVCNFCSNPDERMVKLKASVDDFRKVMRNVGKYVDFSEIRELGLSAKGEPLSNKHFCEIVEISKKEFNFQYVYISTNGAMLTEKKVGKVLDSGLDSIKFSINAINREEYRRVHGKDEFDKVMDNLRRLLDLKKTSYSELKVMISSVVDGDIDKVAQSFKEEIGENYSLINDVRIKKLLFSPARHINSNSILTVKESCPKPFEEVWINPDGELMLCCVDYFGEVKIGNLLTTDFDEVWNGSVMTEIRRMQDEKKFTPDHICLKCLNFNKNDNYEPISRDDK